jgi:hypothetical protein
MALIINSKSPLDELCKAWNINTKHLRSLNIHMNYDDVVTITTESIMDEVQSDELITVVKKYRWEDGKNKAEESNGNPDK